MSNFEDYIIDTYENYELNEGVFLYELSDKDLKILESAIFFLDNKCSLRQLSKEVMISKSVLHLDLTMRLQKLSFEMYSCVKRQLLENKRKYFKYF